MNASRVATWIVGAAVLGAWLASAAGVSRRAQMVPTSPAPAEPHPVDHLAADVQAQAGRLRQRLDGAPAPQAPVRNPFVFSARNEVTARPARAIPTPVFVPPPVQPAEPPLLLVGIAERNVGERIVRTAMISTAVDDLIMVTAGQQVLAIYDVVAIGHDAVELKHLVTGETRRLALR